MGTKQTLKMHLLETHEIDFSKTTNTPYICELFNIVREPNVTTMKTGVQCPACDQVFSSQRSYNDHRRQVHEKHTHIKCDQCDFSSFQPYMLKKHKERQHDKQGLLSCSECEHKFDKKQNLAKHMLSQHNI